MSNCRVCNCRSVNKAKKKKKTELLRVFGWGEITYEFYDGNRQYSISEAEFEKLLAKGESDLQETWLY